MSFLQRQSELIGGLVDEEDLNNARQAVIQAQTLMNTAPPLYAGTANPSRVYQYKGACGSLLLDSLLILL